MERTRWRQIEKLYHAAREFSGKDRICFLAQACSQDAERWGEVHSLLVAAEIDDEFLNTHLLKAGLRLLTGSAEHI